MRRAAAMLSLWLLVGCEPEPRPRPPPLEDAGPEGMDASTAPSDAGGADAGQTLNLDAGMMRADAGGAQDAGPPTERLVVGLGTGQVVSWPFRSNDATVGDAVVAELGAPLAAVARRPGTATYVAATQQGTAMATFQVLTLDADGRWTVRAGGPVGAREVGAMTFDATGTWLLFIAQGAFRVARFNADETLGTSRSLYSCDAQALLETSAGFLGTCRYDNRLVRFDFTPAAGPSNPRVQGQLPGGFNPVSLIPFGSMVALHGAKSNGVMGSENRAGLVTPTSTSMSASVVLKPPNSDLSAVYATVAAAHPTLRVGYFVNGGSAAYGGNHLAVVGGTANDGLEVRQYVSLPWDNSYNSGAVAVTPDGRWLLVGTNVVTEVRAWPIDPATGQLGTSRVPVLADEPVFIEVR
ncbi:MAG: hypothetical protein SFW67_34660 [Myxococcaceae bacterium]|nr:hypothetical protein [Myxococcaceae bacterium]